MPVAGSLEESLEKYESNQPDSTAQRPGRRQHRPIFRPGNADWFDQTNH
jgi:hypothetical protein